MDRRCVWNKLLNWNWINLQCDFWNYAQYELPYFLEVCVFNDPPHPAAIPGAIWLGWSSRVCGRLSQLCLPPASTWTGQSQSINFVSLQPPHELVSLKVSTLSPSSLHMNWSVSKYQLCLPPASTWTGQSQSINCFLQIIYIIVFHINVHNSLKMTSTALTINTFRWANESCRG